MNRREPAPMTAAPDAPAHLSERARQAWPKVVEILLGMGTLTVADGIALEALCECYADLVEARKSLRSRETTTYEGGTADAPIYRSYPEVAQIADADRRLQSWLAKFGLTPADRSKVSAIGSEEKDEWAELKAGS